MDIEDLKAVYEEFLYNYSECEHIKEAVGDKYKDVNEVMYDDLVTKGFTMKEAESLIYTKLPEKDIMYKFIAYMSRFYYGENIKDLNYLIYVQTDVHLEDEKLNKIFEYKNSFKNTKRWLI